MRSKTMKIAAHADFLTVDVASSSVDGALVTRQAKLIFDGKESLPQSGQLTAKL